MKPSSLVSSVVLSAALLSAGSVCAAPTYYDGGYADSVNDYENQRDAYYNARENYAEQRADYERQRLQYERAQRQYDRTYGYGAYARRYGAFDYRTTATNNGYASPCDSRSDSNTVAGAILGAIAGGVVGSNVAARGNRSEGAVLGAIVGGVAGGAIGRSTAHCDNRGYYYSYNDTVPYRESSTYRSGRYNRSYYVNQRCRLTQVEYRGEWRYARVCPDSMGRYRITG